MEDTMLKLVQEAIQKGIREKIESVYEQEKLNFIARLDREKNEALTAITLEIFKHIDFNMSGNRVTITLKTENIPHAN